MLQVPPEIKKMGKKVDAWKVGKSQDYSKKGKDDSQRQTNGGEMGRISKG